MFYSRNNSWLWGKVSGNPSSRHCCSEKMVPMISFIYTHSWNIVSLRTTSHVVKFRRVRYWKTSAMLVNLHTFGFSIFINRTLIINRTSVRIEYPSILRKRSVPQENVSIYMAILSMAKVTIKITFDGLWDILFNELKPCGAVPQWLKRSTRI